MSDDNGDAHIDLSARWPDLAVEGNLRPREKILLAKLLVHLGVSPAGLPDGGKRLAITELGFLAEPAMGKKQFSFHAAVENAWELELPGGTTLSIERLSFYVHYQEGQSPTMRPGFSGMIGVRGLDVSLSAEREANGWTFSGSSGPGEPINVGEWTKKLAAHFGEVVVPEPVARAVLENVVVTFNTGTRDFHFSIEAKMALTEPATNGAGNANGGKELDLTLTLEPSAPRRGVREKVRRKDSARWPGV